MNLREEIAALPILENELECGGFISRDSVRVLIDKYEAERNFIQVLPDGSISCKLPVNITTQEIVEALKPYFPPAKEKCGYED